MHLLASFDVVFSEVPGEVALALNLSRCPHRCEGCHSPHLRERVGEELTAELLGSLLDRYGRAITCVCFMGGDAEPGEVERLALAVRAATDGRLKTAWYSGCGELPVGVCAASFDYIKLGPYVAHLGGLDSETTNQRFYKVGKGAMVDITHVFRGKARQEPSGFSE